MGCTVGTSTPFIPGVAQTVVETVGGIGAVAIVGAIRAYTVVGVRLALSVV
jgi:hypothetical protein